MATDLNVVLTLCICVCSAATTRARTVWYGAVLVSRAWASCGSADRSNRSGGSCRFTSPRFPAWKRLVCMCVCVCAIVCVYVCVCEMIHGAVTMVVWKEGTTMVKSEGVEGGGDDIARIRGEGGEDGVGVPHPSNRARPRSDRWPCSSSTARRLVGRWGRWRRCWGGRGFRGRAPSRRATNR